MKSKTFCFNRTIFKKNVTHYWPVWALYLAYLLLTMPFLIWQISTYSYSGYDEMARMYDIMRSAVSMQVVPFPTFAAAAVMALAVFSYLYSAKSANMIHALPVNRLELYITNYLSGLAFLIIPQLIAFLAAVIVCLANDITCIQYLFYGTLIQMGTAFFAYSFAVFVAMFTGQMLAMPFYFVIMNYLYVGCVYLVSEIINMLCYGVDNAFSLGKSGILSPLYYLDNNVRCGYVYDGASGSLAGIQIYKTSIVGIYAAVAVVMVVLSYQLYKRRQIETAGDWVSIGIIKPVFRWGMALCGGVLLALLFTVFVEGGGTNVYPCVLVFMVIMGFICFFAAEMLLEKNFRVFTKRRLIEWAGFTAAALCFLTLFEFDAFGIEKRIPAEEEIEAAFVYMDYPVQVEEADIAALLEMHEQVIAHKKEYLQYEEQGTEIYYTTFRYYLKDGTTLDRCYALPVAEQYAEDETTPSGWILALERQPENLMKMTFGIDYEENLYFNGTIELYDGSAECRNYTFTEEELSQVVAAIEQDIREGNYASSCLYSISRENSSYYNMIYLEYYNRSGYGRCWDYYSRYWSYVQTEGVSGGTDSRYSGVNLDFGPDCTNLIETLEELGIVDDTWHLYTWEGYDALMNEQ